MRALLGFATAMVLLALPSVVDAQQPHAWLTPSNGTCEEPVVLQGERFPANTTLELVRPEMTDTVALGEVLTDGTGRFEVTLPAEAYPELCRPGQRFAIFARVPGEPNSGGIGVAEYAVETPWRLAIASEATCDATPSFRGSGFPPGHRVSLWFSQDTAWAAHDFAELAYVTTDADGGFVVEALRSLPCTLVGDGVLIVARLSDPLAGYAGWSTWLIVSDHGPPLQVAPAATGQGVPDRHEGPVALQLALVAITLALVAGSRKTTPRSARARRR